MDSILLSIKKLLGPDADVTNFDTDIIIHINSAIAILTQIGVGPPDGYSITGNDEKWSDFIEGDNKKLNSVKTYVYLKVKLVFDPPTVASVLDAIKKEIDMLEWRLNVAAESQNI